MAYTKQSFTDQVLDASGNVVTRGTVLKKEHLDHMEDGIYQAHEQLGKKLSAPASPKVGDYLRIKSIAADGTMVVEGVQAPEAVLPERPTFLDISLVTEQASAGKPGVTLVPEGTEEKPVLGLYGYHDDEPVELCNVAEATEDQSAPNLAQVREMISDAMGGATVPAGTVTLTANGDYDVAQYANAEVAIPEVAQAVPEITVDEDGRIGYTITQEEGYVAGGTRFGSQTQPTQSAKTVTPGVSAKTAVAKGVFTTGEVKVAGDANLVGKNIKKGITLFGVDGTLPEEIEAESLNAVHQWEKYLVEEGVVETEKTNAWLTTMSTGGIGTTTIQFRYADEIKVEDGSITLVGQTATSITDSNKSVIVGKYIYVENKGYYRVPADATVSYSENSYGGSIVVSKIYELSVGEIRTLIGVVLSEDIEAYPAEGEQDGYRYVYIGTLEDTGNGSDSGERPDLYNVKRHGATGDGVTDDTAAIASAIAALPSGGTLYFPAGVYRVSNINVKSNMMVQGDGWCSVIKLLDATDDYHGRNNCLNIENVDNIIIRDIKLDGNRPTQQSTAPSQDGRLDGLHIRCASDILVENVWMYNNGYHGCIMTYATNVVFDRCKATDNGFRPIHGHTQIYNCRVSNCVCENNGLGLTGGSGFENDSIFFFGAQHLVINDNIIKSNRRGCITIGCDQDTTDPEDIVPSRNITVSGNVCECYEDLAYVPSADSDTGVAKFSSKGILVYGGDFVMENVTVSGNTIKNAHEAIEFYSQENTLCSINATVCGNAIIDCSYGVFAVDVGDVTIANNQFQNLACAWMYANNAANCLIQGNNVNSPGNSEAYLCRMYNCAGVIIRDNNLIGDCANAIYVSDSNSTTVVMNNTLLGFTAAEPVTNTNGYTIGNLHIPASEDENTDKVCIDPYPNPGFVRANLANPNTTSTTWSYTTPVEITDADTRYELNTFVSVTSGANPAEYDFSNKNTAIAFLSGIDLSMAVGIVNLANGNGVVSFSESCIEGDTFDVWGLQIAVSAEKVKELFPGATHVMMQIEKDYAEPDNLSATHKALSDGHAYVYRAK